MSQEKYRPSREEVQRAEESMTDEQRVMSDARAEGYKQAYAEQGKLSPEEEDAKKVEDFKRWVEHLADGGPEFWREQSHDFRSGKQMFELYDIGIMDKGNRQMMTDEEAVELLRGKNWRAYLEHNRQVADTVKALRKSIESGRGLVAKNNELGSPISEEEIQKGQVGTTMEYMDWILAKHEAWDRLEKRLAETEAK